MLVTIPWLKENYKSPNTILLDTRPAFVYKNGHISNAHSFPVDKVLTPNQFGAHLVADSKVIASSLSALGVDTLKTIILYGDAQNPSLTRVAWTLEYLGLENINLLDTSANQLEKYDIPLVREVPTPTPAEFVPVVKPNLRITTDTLQQSHTDYSLLDARSPQEYMSAHLPNALSFPFERGVGTDGCIFLNTDNLKKIYQNIPTNKKIICYCAHGHRASNLFYQLRESGFTNVLVYDGSIIDWHGHKLPLE
ncbi:MAG: rhodanese-like domain-containing protein [Candidatus Nitrosoabyssus spongiisocia]|nr:MAG: rhodanese-like domain-containing protein [Nitrosopumilaceae archaeon AB1(1)]